jgi:hypothetical protein
MASLWLDIRSDPIWYNGRRGSLHQVLAGDSFIRSSSAINFART